MRFLFTTVYPDKEDVCSRIEDLPENAFDVGNQVVLYDAYLKKTLLRTTTRDELERVYDDVARSANMHRECGDSSLKVTWNALEATDGFAVKQSAPLTLNQLKMERPLEDANVKTAAAAKKPRVAAIPPIAIMALGTAMQTGADKYGAFNWRETSVTASVFYNAMLRHLEQWYSGENHASDTGVHHLAHLMAGAAIIFDAEMNGVFLDDRPKGVALGEDYAKYFMKVDDVPDVQV